MELIAGVFSISGDDSTGVNGPDGGYNGCYFLHYPSANVVYLKYFYDSVNYTYFTSC